MPNFQHTYGQWTTLITVTDSSKYAFQRIDRARNFFGSRLLQLYQYFLFSKQKQWNFLCFVRSNENVSSFMERALYKWDTGVAQIVLSDWLLQEQLNNKKVKGVADTISANCGLAREHGDMISWFSWLKDDGVANGCPRYESGRIVATGFIARNWWQYSLAFS